MYYFLTRHNIAVTGDTTMNGTIRSYTKISTIFTRHTCTQFPIKSETPHICAA